MQIWSAPSSLSPTVQRQTLPPYTSCSTAEFSKIGNCGPVTQVYCARASPVQAARLDWPYPREGQEDEQEEEARVVHERNHQKEESAGGGKESKVVGRESSVNRWR